MVEWSLYEVRLRRSSAECFGAGHAETLVTVHEWNSFSGRAARAYPRDLEENGWYHMC